MPGKTKTNLKQSVIKRSEQLIKQVFNNYPHSPTSEISSAFTFTHWSTIALQIKKHCSVLNHSLLNHLVSSTLTWKIPWTEEPARLQSMGLLRVGHNWATSLSLFTFMHWRWKWQPTPVFLPGESQGWGSLVSCRLWGHTESDTTDAT